MITVHTDYGIFVEKTGRNSRPHIKSNPIALSSPSITWMGVPVSFAYNPPHVIAYSANLVEVWDVECVTAAQVLPIANVRVVHCEHNIFLRGVPIAGALDVHQQSQASIAEDEADRVRVCELRRVGSDGNSEHGAIMVAGVAT